LCQKYALAGLPVYVRVPTNEDIPGVVNRVRQVFFKAHQEASIQGP
jgi:hypothetical protein